MKTYELLEAAADLIERDGWCQNEYEQDGRHCLVGAMAAIKGPQPAWANAGRALRAALPYPVKGLPAEVNILMWNDHQDRKAEEVLALLRGVAAVEKAREQRLALEPA